MKADAIQRVTIALRGRLEAAISNAGMSGSVFVGPLDDRDAPGALLVLFLYRIVPNTTLRNQERRLASGTDRNIDAFRNSLPLDLYFLLSVGTTEGASEEVPLRTLGFAMRELHLDPILTLSSPNLESELVRVTLEPLTTEESSRIWALFPAVNYRTSVAYLASPVWLDPDAPDQNGVPVSTDQLIAGGDVGGMR